jgi:ribosomal protein S18 acetylase RimI-like enzyme
VDEETPELSIAVVPSKRARGYGNRLLKALMERARDDGFARLSLSVEPDNPSIALYEKFGFRKVGERNGTTTMVADLGRRDPAPPRHAGGDDDQQERRERG